MYEKNRDTDKSLYDLWKHGKIDNKKYDHLFPWNSENFLVYID